MAPRRPNILLVLTDQQRFDTIASLGNRLIKTPVLDRLVRRGTAFTAAYTPTPVCVAARYALLTGKPAHLTGCVANSPMPAGSTSLMEHLAGAGYQTHGVGKMHFTFRSDPRAMWGFESRDFSEEGGGAAGGDDFIAHLQEAGYGHVKDANGVRSEMYYIPQTSQLPAHLHNTAWVADRSLRFLERRDQDRPFFLMTSFIKPHPPFEVPTPWNKLYRGPEMPLPKRPPGWQHLLSYWNHYQNRYKYRDQGIDDNLIRAMRAYYYAGISFIDFHLGRIVSYLEDAGMLQDTLILFTSDHGELLGDYNSFGKRSFLDSAARVPLIACYPGLFDSGVCDSPVTLLDVFPTCLDVAGIGTDQDQRELCGGENLGKIAAGHVPERVVFGQFEAGGKAMYMARSPRWKYIYSAPDQKEWLFDHRVDPGETRNRAYNPMYASQAETLRKALIDHLGCAGYGEPIDGEAWKEYPRLKVPTDPDAGLLFQDGPGSIPAGLEGYTDQ